MAIDIAIDLGTSKTVLFGNSSISDFTEKSSLSQTGALTYHFCDNLIEMSGSL